MFEQYNTSCLRQLIAMGVKDELKIKELPEHTGDFSDHGTFTEFMGRLHSKGKQTKEEKEWELYIAEKRDAQLEAKGLEPKWIKNWGLEKRLAELDKNRKKETKY